MRRRGAVPAGGVRPGRRPPCSVAVAWCRSSLGGPVPGVMETGRRSMRGRRRVHMHGLRRRAGRQQLDKCGAQRRCSAALCCALVRSAAVPGLAGRGPGRCLERRGRRRGAAAGHCGPAQGIAGRGAAAPRRGGLHAARDFLRDRPHAAARAGARRACRVRARALGLRAGRFARCGRTCGVARRGRRMVRVRPAAGAEQGALRPCAPAARLRPRARPSSGALLAREPAACFAPAAGRQQGGGRAAGARLQRGRQREAGVLVAGREVDLSEHRAVRGRQPVQHALLAARGSEAASARAHALHAGAVGCVGYAGRRPCGAESGGGCAALMRLLLVHAWAACHGRIAWSDYWGGNMRSLPSASASGAAWAAHTAWAACRPRCCPCRPPRHGLRAPRRARPLPAQAARATTLQCTH